MARERLDDYEEDPLELWKTNQLIEHDQDRSWITEFARNLGKRLRIQLMGIQADQRTRYLEEWIHQCASPRNSFALVFENQDTELSHSLTLWERRTSPFLEVQDLLSPQEFSSFIGYLYTALKIDKDWRDFDNFHPERATQMSERRHGIYLG